MANCPNCGIQVGRANGCCAVYSDPMAVQFGDVIGCERRAKERLQAEVARLQAVIEAVRQACAAEAPHLDDCLTHCHPAAHCTCGADVRDDERLHIAALLPPKESP